MNVVIIIPTYNEKENIIKLISVLEEEVFPTIKNHTMSILVADDTSPDGTGEEVKKLMGKWKNLELSIGKKHGLGAAYIRAMEYAIEKMDADVVFEMDADFSHDPFKVTEFLEKIEKGNDFVLGTRYSDGGSIPNDWGFRRKMYSILGNFVVRAILMRFTIHDWTGGYRAIRKEVFLKEKEKLKPYTGYTFQVAFLHMALQDGFKAAEVPIQFPDRTKGESKITSGQYIKHLLTYIISARIKELIWGKFGKFLVVGGVGFIVNAIVLETLVKFADWHPAGANLVGAAFAIFSNYNFNNLWTFKDRKSKTIMSYLTRLISFYASSAFGVIFIQTGTIFIGTHTIGEQYYFLYFIFGTGLLLIWNFTMYSKVIWKHKPQG